MDGGASAAMKRSLGKQVHASHRGLRATAVELRSDGGPQHLLELVENVSVRPTLFSHPCFAPRREPHSTGAA